MEGRGRVQGGKWAIKGEEEGDAVLSPPSRIQPKMEKGASNGQKKLL